MSARLEDEYCSKYNISKSSFNNDRCLSFIVDQLKNIVAEEKLKARHLKKRYSEEHDAGEKGNEDNLELTESGLVDAPYFPGPALSEVQKDIQRLRYAVIIEKIINTKGPIYTAHYFDFRGRIYPKSAASFMYLKLIRGLFRGESTLFCENSIKSSEYYSSLLKEGIYLGHPYDHPGLNGLDRYFLIILFLELGKLKKKSIRSHGVTLQQFVNKGIEIYKRENPKEIEIDDLNYYYSICDCISEFYKTQTWSEITIIRDSTASSFQHWGTALGIKDNYYGSLNLKGTK